MPDPDRAPRAAADQTGRGPSYAVVVPLHDGARYIRATLDSLGAQTVQPAEVIVVDDGSTDGGEEIVASYRFDDGTRPRLIRHEHPLGVAASRNHGAAAARGDWISFCDHDDLWHPLRMERILTASAASPDRVAIATGVTAFALDSDRDLLQAHPRRQMVDVWVADDRLDTLTLLSNGGRRGLKDVTVADLQRHTCFPTSSIAFRSDAFRMAGGYPLWNNALGDWVFHAAVASLRPILVIDEPLVFYRVRPHSQSHDPEPLARGGLAVMLALRLGEHPDERPASIVYAHMVRTGARSGFSLTEVAGFICLGRLGLRESLSILKEWALHRGPARRRSPVPPTPERQS